MEREQFHYHVDVMTPDSHLIVSSPALPKSAAKRLFRSKVADLQAQVGKFRVRSAVASDAEKGFVGAIRIAENHRVVVVLTRCDCDN